MLIQQSTGAYSPVRRITSKAIISLDRLLKILSAPSGHHIIPSSRPLDIDLLQMCTGDLQTVLEAQSRIRPLAQGKAHSILNEDRFFEWLRQSHPDMLVVDGNIEESAGDAISPMSLFCANFGLAMAKREPQSVFAHFYCGLNTDLLSGNWYGPVGMLRSLAVQLMVSLNQRDRLSLDFLDDRDDVRKLEKHDPEALCQLLHNLLQEFDVDTTVYVMIDGMTQYDSGLGDVTDSTTAIQNLQETVRDTRLRPSLKVLMTAPFRFMPPMKNVIYDGFFLELLPSTDSFRELSECAILSSISTPLTLSTTSILP